MLIPLIFSNPDRAVSGGNFHGEPVAIAMDALAIGLAELANISERRIAKLVDSATNEGLPLFLIAPEKAGLHNGLMIAQYTSAALVSENKYLCHPASVDSVPTSTDKEDHVSMGVTAGRKLHEVIENAKSVLAIELLCNTQALDFQRPNKTSPALEAVHALIRRHVDVIENDRIFYKDINNITKLIDSKEIVSVVETQIGALL